MPCCEINDCAQTSKTIIAVRHFGLGGRESLETAVTVVKFNCFFIQAAKGPSDLITSSYLGGFLYFFHCLF